MKYIQVYLRSVPELYTWAVPEHISASPGDLVLVPYRGKRRSGVVIQYTFTTPVHEIKPIYEVLEPELVPELSLLLARYIAQSTLTSLPKVLSVMIPERIMTQKRAATKTLYYAFTGAGYEGLRGAKQQEAIQRIADAGGIIRDTELRNYIGLGTIKTLINKGLLRTEYGPTESCITVNHSPQKRTNHKLNTAQKQAYEHILSASKPVLLWGVTGSGKTEIYKHLAAHYIQQNNKSQVLVLVPEIGLIGQMVEDFRALLGTIDGLSESDISVWHSGLTQKEKHHEWLRIRSGAVKILIGTRSAVLVPMPYQRLIIMDEEHEWTYKSESAPRFWTHDVIRYITQRTESTLSLGSATPSVTSFLHVKQGDYSLMKLPERIQKQPMPHTEIIDMRLERKKGNKGPLSKQLYKALTETINAGQQAVLFLNKRGIASQTLCLVCGSQFHCRSCDSTMKLHKKGHNHQLICHLCGAMERYKGTCPECGATEIEHKSWGTQAVEKYLQETFPGVGVLRADADTITQKHAFDTIRQDFSAGKAAILLGTQMITKGLDFKQVSLVAALQADTGLSLPDYQTEERIYQLITQVSGRAGRHNTTGRVLLQTYNPDNPLWGYILQHNTEEFIMDQLQQRKALYLPPYSAVAKLTIVNKNRDEAYVISRKLYTLLESKKPENAVINWAPAFTPRMHNQYYFHVFIRSQDYNTLLSFLRDNTMPERVRIDIMPVSLL